MGILSDLRKLSSAEDFFEALAVDYDPAVVRVARLHILRRMGEYLAAADLESAPDEEARAACKERLARAYADFVASTPIEQRLFKVHKDAVKPKAEPPKPFVPFSLLIGTDSRPL
jgi:nitrogenase-stabilizing/protective protein